MRNYDLEIEELQSRYLKLEELLKTTNKDIKDWRSRSYKTSRRIIVNRHGIASNVKAVNERNRDRIVNIYEDNKKQLLKGIDRLHEEMKTLILERQNDMEYGWSTENELEFR